MPFDHTAPSPTEPASPDPIDVHVGARLRQLRKAQEVSQSELGEALGVTFQQVQKYERGANRISASMMYRACARLGVPSAALYDGLPLTYGGLSAETREDARIRLLACDPEARRMMLLFDQLLDAAKATVIASAELMAPRP